MPLTAIAIFCEDIRTEQSGIETLIGIMPDNIIVMAEEPKDGARQALSKVGLYTRINFDKGAVPSRMSIRLLDPMGEEVGTTEVDQAVFAAAVEASGDLPFCGIKSPIVIRNFPVMLGVYRVFVETDIGDITAGALNIRLLSPPS